MESAAERLVQAYTLPIHAYFHEHKDKLSALEITVANAHLHQIDSAWLTLLLKENRGLNRSAEDSKIFVCLWD